MLNKPQFGRPGIRRGGRLICKPNAIGAARAFAPFLCAILGFVPDVTFAFLKMIFIY